MIGLDTSQLVRYLTQDDQEQFRSVMTLLCRKGAWFFVPDLVLVELDWVLTAVYGWSKTQVADALTKILTVHNLSFADEGRLRTALRAVRRGAELADELIAAACREHGCGELATFDGAFASRHGGFAFVPE
jgi:predicted nucleic-acid-binding protein